MNKLIKTIKKNTLDEIRVELSEYRGHNLIAIRVYSDFGDGEEKKPTKKGLTCNVSLIPVLREALEKADAEARKAGVLRPL